MLSYVRQAISANGGTPFSFRLIDAWRELVTAYGGAPTQFTVVGLMREAITAVGGTPTQFTELGLLRELLTAMGETVTSFNLRALYEQLAATTSGGGVPSLSDFDANMMGAMISADVLADANDIGSVNAARPSSKTLARNLYGAPFGPRQAGSGPTVTLAAAAGPTYSNTATRVLYTVATQLFSLWASSARPSVGTYTVRFKAKSNTGSDFAIRYGNSTVGYNAGTALAASWTTFTVQFTTTGSDWTTFTITGDGANTPDILVDEVQIYQAVSASVPAISTEAPGDDFVFPFAYTASRFTGNLLDNTAATALGSGLLRMPGYPVAKAFTAITLIVAVELTTKSTNQTMISVDQNSSLGTTTSTLSVSAAQADGNADFTGISAFYYHDLANQGIMLLGMRVANGAQAAFLDNIELGSASAAFAGFSAKVFRVGANAAAETLVQTTFRLQGRIAGAFVFDKALTDTEYANATTAIRASLTANTVSLGSMPAFLIGLGDSQTSAMSGTRGPSWLALQGVAATHTPNLPLRNLATGGYTLDNVKAQLLTIQKLVLQAVARTGRKAIVAIYIGTNDQTEIAANPSAYWARLNSELLSVIAGYGARICVANMLPDGSTAGWEATRATYNPILSAGCTANGYYLMDFAGQATVGSAATTSNLTYYEADQRHMTSASHALIAPIATAAIAAAIAA